jgi:serine/threonine-protein kinase
VALASGSRIGVYEVAAPIGAGGMGEVYRARDTRLQRDVAIKVLPDTVAQDAERLSRFEREARTLASLNHPNIAQIYGFEDAGGVMALVMELVEGPTLGDRIARGPVPLDDALPIAKQIAEALEAAHEQGIVHRDLKPANIKVRSDGTVKVLDFGLAKALEPAVAAPSVTQSPTITTPAMTRQGTILGTAAYMSPEQAKGRPADRRSDVWAFGAVFFEMLTGTRAFGGDDVSETLADVMRVDPAWEKLPAELSPTLATFLKRALQKDVRQRLGDMRDMRLALEGVFETAGKAAVHPLARPTSRGLVWLAAGVGLLIGAGIATVVWMALSPGLEQRPVQRFVFTLPAGQQLPMESGTLVAISPDGQTLVYRARENGVFGLYRRALSETVATPIAGTAGAAPEPFFSPDGQWLAFEVGTTVMKVLLTGGQPVEIAEVGQAPRGGSWQSDVIVVAGDIGLVRVSANGGEASVLAAPSDGRAFWYPQLLADGQAVLFTASLSEPDGGEVALLDLRTGEQRTLVQNASAGWYAPTGHLVFVRAGDLWAVRFDLERLEVTGDAAVVEQGIRVEPTGHVQVTAGEDGTLAYIGGDVSAGASRELVWVDRQGREEAVPAPRRAYQYPRIAPDGSRIALDIRDQENDIWIWEFARQTLTRFTFDPRQDEFPVWTPDGRGVLFGSSRAGTQSLFLQAADGTGSPVRLTQATAEQNPTSMSPDGSSVVFYDFALDVHALSMTGERRARPLVQTGFAEANGEVSPDGRWLAYQSNESGRSEIYVQPFPAVGAGRWLVSTSGGVTPLWSRSGGELFFRSLDGAVMRVAFEGGGTAWKAGPPVELFPGGSFFIPDFAIFGRTFDVSPDGQRFLMIKTETTAGDEERAEIVIVQNFFEQLRRLLPAE